MKMIKPTDYEKGYSEGHTEGYHQGYSEGHDDGYHAGYSKGRDFAPNYSEGFDDGHKSGYSEGFDDGKEAGYNEGQKETYQEAYCAGYKDAYSAGYNDACAHHKIETHKLVSTGNKIHLVDMRKQSRGRVVATLDDAEDIDVELLNELLKLARRFGTKHFAEQLKRIQEY